MVFRFARRDQSITLIAPFFIPRCDSETLLVKGSMLSRRTFLKKNGAYDRAALPLTASLPGLDGLPAVTGDQSTATIPSARFTLASLPQRSPAPDAASQPWQKHVRRVGQTNMTEHDPAVMDVDAWADYWHSAKVDAVFVSVTGILAFYPSKVPFHRHGKFLNGRDFFGECTAAAKKRGMRVVARMSPDLNWGDALQAHPEWAMRNKDDSAQLSNEEPRLFKTCMFSTYMDDYVPAIMREINSLYDVDCFYTNGWPPLGSLPECHCAVCSKLPASGTPAYWRVFDDRVLRAVASSTTRSQRRKSTTVFSLPISAATCAAAPISTGWARLQHGFRPTTRGAPITMPLSGDAVCKAASATRCWTASLPPTLLPLIPPARRGGATHRKIPPRRTMWLNETLASGMVPYYHFVGSENGLGEDRRWQKVGADYFGWTAQHDAHFTRGASIANIGVVIGQSTQLLYPGPAAVTSHGYMHETTKASTTHCSRDVSRLTLSMKTGSSRNG